MLMIIAVFGCLVAVWMLWKGLRPRRAGDTPFCRTCGYNLTGLTSERCPECGRLVAEDGVVYGVRRRRPRLAVIGTIILVVCASLVANHWLNLDWTRYKPSFWLISEVQGGGLVSAQRAIKELDSRFTAGKLSARTQSRLIDYCLKVQAAEPPSPIRNDLMSFLGSAYSAGLLSETQKNLMFKQSVKYELRVRPRVVVGEELPLMLNCCMYGPILPSGQSLSLEIKSMEAFVDNGFRTDLGGSSASMASPGCWLGDGRKLATSTWPAGRHVLRVKASISLYAFAGKSGTAPVYQQGVTLDTPFELLAAEPPGGLVRGIRDDAIKETLGRSFRVEYLRYADQAIDGSIGMNLHGPVWNRGPVPVAFDVIVRLDGREIPMTTVASLLKPPCSHSSGFCSHRRIDLPASATCDVILRPSPEAARKTTDLYEYWDGELVIPNVPIAGLSPAPSKATTSTSAPASGTRPSTTRPAAQRRPR